MFKTMTGVLDPKKKPSPEEIQKIPSFIFCRWLSGNPITIGAANMINRFHNIPIENQYKLIHLAFAGKIKYIPYPKNVSEKEEKKLDYLQEHFNINREMAREYLQFISKKELKSIITMYSERDSK